MMPQSCVRSGAPFSSAWIGAPGKGQRTSDGAGDGDGLEDALQDPAGAAKSAAYGSLNATFDGIIAAGIAGQNAARAGKDFIDDMNTLTTGGLGDAISQMKALVPEGAFFSRLIES